MLTYIINKIFFYKTNNEKLFKLIREKGKKIKN